MAAYTEGFKHSFRMQQLPVIHHILCVGILDQSTVLNREQTLSGTSTGFLFIWEKLWLTEGAKTGKLGIPKVLAHATLEGTRLGFPPSESSPLGLVLVGAQSQKYRMKSSYPETFQIITYYSIKFINICFHTIA